MCYTFTNLSLGLQTKSFTKKKRVFPWQRMRHCWSLTCSLPEVWIQGWGQPSRWWGHDAPLRSSYVCGTHGCSASCPRCCRWALAKETCESERQENTGREIRTTSMRIPHRLACPRAQTHPQTHTALVSARFLQLTTRWYRCSFLDRGRGFFCLGFFSFVSGVIWKCLEVTSANGKTQRVWHGK